MKKLINEIDSLDIYRRGLMDKLHQLRDITLFYDRLYPELHIIQTPNSATTEDSSTATVTTTTAPEAERQVSKEDIKHQEADGDSHKAKKNVRLLKTEKLTA